jgi:hypothetical protein
MTRRIVFSTLALLAFASVANAGIVDPANSWATMNNEPGVMTIAPGGADSFIFPTDYTIDVYVNDSGGNPVEIVASDIWLDNPATVPCPGGWIADSSTYSPDPGHTTFTGTPRGGVPVAADCRGSQTDVIAVGNVIHTLNLRFNSPDLNGDGEVTVGDFAVFAGYFNQPCTNQAWCADLDESDELFPLACVGVGDFAIFASFFNISECP